jgi:hypothetical protein
MTASYQLLSKELMNQLNHQLSSAQRAVRTALLKGADMELL